MTRKFAHQQYKSFPCSFGITFVMVCIEIGVAAFEIPRFVGVNEYGGCK